MACLFVFPVFLFHSETIPDFKGNAGSFRVRVKSRQAVPSGRFLPASQASTVFTETPIYFANRTCVKPVLFPISLISPRENWFVIVPALNYPPYSCIEENSASCKLISQNKRTGLILCKGKYFIKLVILKDFTVSLPTLRKGWCRYLPQYR